MRVLELVWLVGCDPIEESRRFTTVVINKRKTRFRSGSAKEITFASFIQIIERLPGLQGQVNSVTGLLREDDAGGPGDQLLPQLIQKTVIRYVSHAKASAHQKRDVIEAKRDLDLRSGK